MTKKPSLTATMIVKNDDQWVWYAINAVLPSIDTFLITDTGSTDRTVDIIRSIKNPKIHLTTANPKDPKQLADIRSKQLRQTKTEWLWMVDADEIYPQKTIEEILRATSVPKVEGMVIRRYDCLGDIYHYQSDETVGGYGMFGQVAHFSLRLVRTTLPGLHMYGSYPNEGFADKTGSPLVGHTKENFYISHNRYLHATYLKRSSSGENLTNTFHRQKFKQELGKTIPVADLPAILTVNPPPSIPRIQKRSLKYLITATLITPFKLLKRQLRS